MSNELERYSLITTKMPREFLLLQGKGCVWKKCTYCDYYNDISDNPFEINKAVINKITGELGTVDVINSGSVFELDALTMEYLRAKLYEKNVKTLWCEAHWLYHGRLNEIRDFFKGISVKFRIGAETFDVPTRNAWQKGIPDEIGAQQISKHFDGCCLLVCVEGQTRDMILHDIELAEQYFEYFNINAFVENSTPLKRDNALCEWFCKEIAPELDKKDNVEILINNTDLGVG